MLRSIRIVLALLCVSGFAHGQALSYVPRAMGAYVSPGGTGAAGTWYAASGSGSSPIPYVPYAQAVYVSTDGSGNAGTWVPWTGTSGGAPTTCTSGNNYACLNTANAFTANQAINATTGNPLVITDSDAVSGNIFMNTMNATAPASGANIIDELGKNENNGGLWRITHYVGLNNGGNYYMHLSRGGSIPGYAMILINNHTIINGSTDAGYMFDVIGSARAASYSTNTNCSSTASPAVCGSSPAGKVQVAAAATTLQVNTTAITASSECSFTYSVAGITAPVNMASLLQPYESTRTAATSFTITLPVAPTTNPVNVMYSCIN